VNELVSGDGSEGGGAEVREWECGSGDVSRWRSEGVKEWKWQVGVKEWRVEIKKGEGEGKTVSNEREYPPSSPVTIWCRLQTKKFEMVGHFSNSSWIWSARCTEWMHHAEILISHFGEMVGNWPVASCYFALCSPMEKSSRTTLHYIIQNDGARDLVLPALSTGFCRILATLY